MGEPLGEQILGLFHLKTSGRWPFIMVVLEGDGDHHGHHKQQQHQRRLFHPFDVGEVQTCVPCLRSMFIKKKQHILLFTL